MSIPVLATSYCPGNGLIHMSIEEYSNENKSLFALSSELHFTSRCNSSCYVTKC